LPNGSRSSVFGQGEEVLQDQVGQVDVFHGESA
jgi:hypothetical protein